jgi:phenylalanyl-tRNA synthetase beta chain
LLLNWKFWEYASHQLIYDILLFSAIIYFRHLCSPARKRLQANLTGLARRMQRKHAQAEKPFQSPKFHATMRPIPAGDGQNRGQSMLISLNWLTDYVDVSLNLDELSRLFMDIGLNVEGVDEAGDDVVFDLEVTSNRPDCLGHIGVARELAAATGKPLKMPPLGTAEAAGEPAEELTSVTVDAPDLCPRYLARVIRNVKVGPSPDWLVTRLEALGLRSVNNIVDVTNYVLMEYSQPLHAFDYDKLGEHRIVVRRGVTGEVMKSIDETKCKLDESMLVIADANKPVAIAGVMGGLETEVSESTTAVLLEVAQFDPLNIRQTSRKLGLMSDSNYRFERGIDPMAMDDVAQRACDLIVQVAGGQLAPGSADVCSAPASPWKVTLRPARTDALLGMATPVEKQVEILAALGLEPVSVDGVIECTIPTFRADLTREVDLIEEIARHVGFDNIPVNHKITHSVVAENLSRRARRTVAQAMTAAGFDEAITFTFVDEDEAALFVPGEVLTVDATVRRSNNALRKSVLNSLLRAAKANQDVGETDINLHELAAVFVPHGTRALPEEHTELAMLTTESLRHLRGAVELLAKRLCPLSTLSVTPSEAAGFEPGQAATILLDDEPIGTLGVVASAVQHRYDLERSVAAARIDFNAMLAKADQLRTYQPLPRFPAITRDLSLIVDEAVTWQQLETLIASIDQPLRQNVDYVTTYRGKPIEKGKKSMTLQLVFRSEEGTLRNEQIDPLIDDIVAKAAKTLQAALRT